MDESSADADEEFLNRLSRVANRIPEKLQQLLGKAPVGHVGHHSFLSPSDSPELTSLHQAIKEKSLKTVNALIREGVDVNGCHANPSWGFPLIHAFEQGDKRVLRALLKAGANPNVCDLLAYCVKENNLSLAKLLIEYGADLAGQPTWEKDENFETNLIRATRRGQHAFVKLLLERGADPNVHNADNESALLIATINRDKRLTRLLKDHASEAECKWVEERQDAAYEDKLRLDVEIYDAIHAGQTDHVLELVERSRRDFDQLLDPENGSPLEEALEAYMGAVRESSPHKRDANAAEMRATYKPDYRHPKVVATRRTVDALLALGAPVEIVGWRAPLAYLTFLEEAPEDIELGMKLIEHAKDINAPITCERATALRLVVTPGWLGYKTTFVKALLERGADPNARNCYNESVLFRAREVEASSGPNPCVPLLLAAGAEEE